MARPRSQSERSQAAARRMHQTTLRFAPDLWDALSEEAQQVGVSVAQYVREAALARLAYTAGRRGDPMFESALHLVAQTRGHDANLMALGGNDQARERTAALWAKSRQAGARAREQRDGGSPSNQSRTPVNRKPQRGAEAGQDR